MHTGTCSNTHTETHTYRGTCRIKASGREGGFRFNHVEPIAFQFPACLWAPGSPGVNRATIILKNKTKKARNWPLNWSFGSGRNFQQDFCRLQRAPGFLCFAGSEFLLNRAHYALDRQEGADILCREEGYPFKEKKNEMNGFFEPAPT